jgi:branched-chain amino acid transport system permease protein
MDKGIDIAYKKMFRPLLFFMIFLGIAPFIYSHPFYRHVLTLTFLFAFISEAWNLISGYGGLFSLAHAAFFGVGAYATAILYVEVGIAYRWNIWRNCCSDHRVDYFQASTILFCFGNASLF